ncbi:MAG: alpha/beta fold hydrolase [Segniliparus sp.]|uniref:alpha/beta fold hydrolase n=1 Tax=Segniliparus sp. TaxID=2804064 RepID=UPI003F3D96EF
MGRLSSFTNDGLTFDVLDEGRLDGPVVIALHGFPQTSSSWSGVIPFLVAAGYRVLAPDQRGYSPGARPEGVKPYQLERLAEDVVALADQAGAERFDVISHDWGAGIAWRLAAARPDRVRTLVALSVPHPKAFLLAGLRGSQLLHSWYILVFQLPWLPERLWQFSWARTRLVKLLGAPESALPDIESVLGDPDRAKAAINWYRALRLPSSLRGIPGRVHVPTLFVWSDADVAVTRKAAELCGEQVDGPYRFEVFEGVSHWIPDERPEEVAELVIAHLSGHAKAQG